MARQYVVDGRVRFFAGVMEVLTRLGLSGATVLMTTTGRQSHEARTIPVSPIEVGGQRYLVSPYGQRGWVHNLRARPTAVFRRRSRSEPVTVTEVDPAQAVPVLQAYYARERITRPYFDVPDHPTAADFARVADCHPVFAVHPGQGDGAQPPA